MTECSNPQCNCHFGVDRSTVIPTDMTISSCGRNGRPLTEHDRQVMVSAAWSFHDQLADRESPLAASVTAMRERTELREAAGEPGPIERIRAAVEARAERRTERKYVDRRSAASGERSDDD